MSNASQLLDTSYVKSFFNTHKKWYDFLQKMEEKQKFYLLSLIYLQQDEIFQKDPHSWPKEKLKMLLEKLEEIDTFYASIGGIIGYHNTFMQLIKNHSQKDAETTLSPATVFSMPHNVAEVKEKAIIGLKHLAETAFILVAGGAGDRLNLHDPFSQKPLPAAFLSFAGKTLLEWLIEEIQALENYYLQTYHKTCLCPIVLLTSEEKDNHQKICDFLKEKNNFSRPLDSFSLCQQPTVPLISEKGRWAFTEDFTLLCKPGGHGALWKAMLDNQGFAFLKKQQRKYALIRQLNNPVGSCDYNLLSLLGYGITEKKKFGFLSCPRRPLSATGSLVLKQRKTNQGYFYNHANIEYCDLVKNNILDESEKNSNFSKYPANTNTLFIDISEVEEKIRINPLLSMSINLKNTYVFDNKEYKVGRPEMLMQNLADTFAVSSEEDINKVAQKKLATFILCNEQRKTLKPIKHLLQKDKILETPESCLYAFMENYYEILSQTNTLPPLDTYENTLKQGLPYYIYLSSFLGPLFSQIASKIQETTLQPLSELFLHLSHIECKKMQLQGSLVIQDQSSHTAKCYLRNLHITNAGLSSLSLSDIWQSTYKRKESLEIILEKDSEFIAENMHFTGNIQLYVPSKHRMIIEGDNKNWKPKLIAL